MYKIWLKPYWKNIFHPHTAVVHIAGGAVETTVHSKDVRLTIIDHDNLLEEIPSIMQDMCYDYNNEIYANIIQIIEETGIEDVEVVIKSLMEKK